MSVQDPQALSIHVQGAIHTIKEMELDTKSQEAIKAVKSVNLEVELSKMAYKDDLKKGERDNTSQQAVGDSKAAPDKAKRLKNSDGDKSRHAAVVTSKVALDEA